MLFRSIEVPPDVSKLASAVRKDASALQGSKTLVGSFNILPVIITFYTDYTDYKETVNTQKYELNRIISYLH